MKGRKDSEKAFLVHNSATLHQSSTKLLLSLSAIIGFRVWNQDITQAYTQSALALMSTIFSQPSKKDLQFFEMPSEQVLQLLRPLYGIADAGNYWNATMVKHMLIELGLSRTDNDLSLFYHRQNNSFNGFSGTCVDDSLHAGSQDYMELTDKSQQSFLSREGKFDNSTFNSTDIASQNDGSFTQSQKFYIERLQLLPSTRFI